MGLVSKEEVFLMFIIFQSRSVHSVAFLKAGLAKVATQVVENIYVGGTVTHIVIALGLRNRVAHLEPLCGYNLIDIEHCLNRGLVKQERSDTFKILVLYEPVHQFTIPNPERTNIHNRDNWRYLLGNKEEYHPSSTENASSSPLAEPNNPDPHTAELTSIQTDISTLSNNLHHFMDSMREHMYHVYQELYFICRFLSIEDNA